jgi:hypothetical protein
LAGTPLFYEKIRQRTALFWFGLRDVGIRHSQAVTQRTTIVSSAFLEHSSADKITVCAHTNCDPNKQEVGLIFVGLDQGIFVFSGSELLTLFKY